MASSTTALVASRSHTIVVGETSSNRVFAMPAPNWTDRIPKSTSQIGETRRCAPMSPAPPPGQPIDACRRARHVRGRMRTMNRHRAAGRDPQGPLGRDVRPGPGGLARSPDRTSTWRRSTPAWSTPAFDPPRLTPAPRPAGSGPRVRRSDDLGETWAGGRGRRHPVPGGQRRERRADLAAGGRPRAGDRVGRHRARCGVALVRRRAHLRAGAEAVGPPAPAGVGRRVRRPGVPHDPARTPTTRTR